MRLITRFNNYLWVSVLAADVLRGQTGGRLGLLVDRLHDRRQGQLGHFGRHGRRARERLRGIVGPQQPRGLDTALGSDGRQSHWNRYYDEVSVHRHRSRFSFEK